VVVEAWARGGDTGEEEYTVDRMGIQGAGFRF
jgi:hypothetical protein